MSWIVKIILLGLIHVLSLAFADKTKYFVCFSFDSILKLINDISSDLQKLRKCFNSTAIVACLKNQFSPSPNIFQNSLALYSKD